MYVYVYLYVYYTEISFIDIKFENITYIYLYIYINIELIRFRLFQKEISISFLEILNFAKEFSNSWRRYLKKADSNSSTSKTRRVS